MGKENFIGGLPATERTALGIDANTMFFINSVNDLPPSISGVRTLAGGTYFSNTPINIGTDVLYLPPGVGILWIGGQITGTGSRIFRSQGNLGIIFSQLTNTVGDCIFVDHPQSVTLCNQTLLVSPFSVGMHVSQALLVSMVQCEIVSCAVGINIIDVFKSSFYGLTLLDNQIGIKWSGTISSSIVNGPVIQANAAITTAKMIVVDNTASIGNLTITGGGTLQCTGSQIAIQATSSSFGAGGLNLNGLQFNGNGTYLSGISVNNLETRFIGNSGQNGFENTAPSAFITINSGATGTAFTTAYTKILGTFTLNSSQLFTLADNKITYIGGAALTLTVTALITGTTSTPSSDIFYALFKNGVTQVSPDSFVRASSSSATTTVVSSLVLFNPGDFVEVFGKVGTGTLTFTWTSGSLRAS